MTPYQSSSGGEAVEVSALMTIVTKRSSQTYLRTGFLHSRYFVVKPELYKSIDSESRGGIRHYAMWSS